MHAAMKARIILALALYLPAMGLADTQPQRPLDEEKTKQLICRSFAGMARDAMQAKLDGKSHLEATRILQERFLPITTNDYSREVFEKRIEYIIWQTFHLLRDIDGSILPAAEQPKLAYDYGIVEYQECMKSVVNQASSTQ
ncbi:MAG: hypothetical protein Q4B94_05960 [Pseudomonadota bacterium]|nr:hypothetical protein [Pseudomonadota bacterium]